MSISFCIITGGQRSELLKTVITSIRSQNIPEFEVVVSGKHHLEEGLTYVEAEEAAAEGNLSALRNKAVERTKYENIVILDDDIILSTSWYKDFKSYTKHFDILTSQVRLPDGSRYLDHATFGGPKGNVILDEKDDDDYLYMTGGGGWVMKNNVAKNVSWDENRKYYQEEDVYFSRKCQAHGFKISHNHKMVVFHSDATYTCIGKVVARRKEGRSHEWLNHEFADQSTLQNLICIMKFKKKGAYAEAADLVRMGMLKGRSRWLYRLIWRGIIYKLGGDLPDNRWSPTGDPEYLRTLEKYRNIYRKKVFTDEKLG